jgi:hypothetical protein
LKECLRHIFRRAALVTLDPKVLRLKRCTALEEAQSAAAGIGSGMNEPRPRKVVDVTRPTRRQKASRDGIGILGALVASRTAAALMDEPAAFWAVAIRFQIEQAGVERRK